MPRRIQVIMTDAEAGAVLWALSEVLDHHDVTEAVFNLDTVEINRAMRGRMRIQKAREGLT